MTRNWKGLMTGAILFSLADNIQPLPFIKNKIKTQPFWFVAWHEN
jgi:ABC-type uncharacterized transport system YnjBCD substrate-binding protein